MDSNDTNKLSDVIIDNMPDIMATIQNNRVNAKLLYAKLPDDYEELSSIRSEVKKRIRSMAAALDKINYQRNKIWIEITKSPYDAYEVKFNTYIYISEGWPFDSTEEKNIAFRAIEMAKSWGNKEYIEKTNTIRKLKQNLCLLDDKYCDIRTDKDILESYQKRVNAKIRNIGGNQQE